MYSSYSTLQRKQLTKQVYTDTQSTYLLVYAPGRHQALEHALENQLHRKFRLVTELAPALTDSVEGVLLVSEDLECTSTALTYFAAALRTGADFVVCDAAFGFDGSTALYLSTQHIPCSRCAMVSRKLLDRVRAAARGRDSVTELLRLATAMAENCHRIPQSLLHFRRELCADDVFSADGKRALILSHELTMTGAPIVLTSAVPVLRSMGFEVVVLGPADDGSLPLFLDAGAAVVTPQRLRDELVAVGPCHQCRFCAGQHRGRGSRREHPERLLRAGAVVAARCLCRLPVHCAQDSQNTGLQCACVRRRLPRHCRHALGAAGLQH